MNPLQLRVNANTRAVDMASRRVSEIVGFGVHDDESCQLGTPKDVRLFPEEAASSSSPACSKSPSSSIPIAPSKQSEIDAQFDQDTAIAEYRDYVMYSRIMNAKKRQRHSAPPAVPAAVVTTTTKVVPAFYPPPPVDSLQNMLLMNQQQQQVQALPHMQALPPSAYVRLDAVTTECSRVAPMVTFEHEDAAEEDIFELEL